MPVVFRVATVHPALAHITIGGVVIIALAYLVGVWRREARWSFAGDVALLVVAPLSLATAGMGLVSDAVVPWPGGLETFRLVHLLVGLSSASGLLLLGVVRWRRRLQSVGVATTVAAVTVAAMVAVTGWIGGEVLVFHSGMAVRAAGDGALSPPLVGDHAGPGFLGAMREARAGWGGVHGELAWMLVHQPRNESFVRILDDAERLSTAAHTMAQSDDVAELARTLQANAAKISFAARAKDLAGIARALGETDVTCARCHAESRWE